MNSVNKELLKMASERISKHKNLLIIAGKELSNESGFADYRNQDLLFKDFPAFEKLGVNFEDCANSIFFQKFPHKAWYFYGYRFNIYKNSKPNDNYKILNKIQKKYFDNMYFICSSNVDGHFRSKDLKFSKDRILEFHGSIDYVQCYNCNTVEKSKLENFFIFDKDICEVNQLPRCIKCDKLLRPNIKLQNDSEFVDSRFNKQYENYKSYLENLNDFTIIEMGVPIRLQNIRNIGEKLLNSKKCSMIRINSNDVSISNSKKYCIIDKNNKLIDNKKNIYIGIESNLIDAMDELKLLLL